MTEPAELVEARKYLSRAEAALFSKNALFDLEEGLGLLQELIDSGAHETQALARNIGKTYGAKLYSAIGSVLAADRNVPEPQLEHLFQFILILDSAEIDLPSNSREIKIALGRELLSRYLEGHAAEEKRAAIEELMRIAEGSSEK